MSRFRKALRVAMHLAPQTMVPSLINDVRQNNESGGGGDNGYTRSYETPTNKGTADIPSYGDMLSRQALENPRGIAEPGIEQRKAIRDINEISAADAAGRESNYAHNARINAPERYGALQRAVLGDQVRAAGTYSETPEFLAGFNTEAKDRSGGSQQGIQAANYGYLAAGQRTMRQPIVGLPSRQYPKA